MLADRYELIDEIGRGRSAVYRARDTRLGRDVAVKHIDLVGGPSAGGVVDVRARALREARAVARITSPYVVGVYDVVEEPDAVWLVMELVPSPSLAKLVCDEGPLTERQAARIGLGVLAALDAAHAEGIVHRDVKPGNVLVDVSHATSDLDADETEPLPVKLADFGVVALRDETSMTSPGAVIGSPSYMAPEQATGQPVGPPADLWALGATLYFAVEGEPPFLADSALATATAVVHGEPRPQQRADQLSRLITLLLDKQPENRPDSHRVRAILRSVAGHHDSGESTGPLAVGPLAASVGPDPAADNDATDSFGPVPPAARRSIPSPRRAVWAAAAAVILIVAIALQLSGSPGADGPEADADSIESGEPSTPPAPSTTIAEVVALDGDDRTEAGDEDRPVQPSGAAEPSAEPGRGRPDRGSPDTTVPPSTTTSEPPSTTTTESPDPDVTTPPSTEPTPSTTEPSPPTTVTGDEQVAGPGAGRGAGAGTT